MSLDPVSLQVLSSVDPTVFDGDPKRLAAVSNTKLVPEYVNNRSATVGSMVSDDIISIESDETRFAMGEAGE
jgi:hypothetical protein